MFSWIVIASPDQARTSRGLVWITYQLPIQFVQHQEEDAKHDNQQSSGCCDMDEIAYQLATRCAFVSCFGNTPSARTALVSAHFGRQRSSSSNLLRDSDMDLCDV